jgi:bifunctional non-homologous end joining protein LigD
MLATLYPEPFDRPGWIYEEKYDGYRILAYKEGSKVTLMSRNDKDRTASYPQIAAAVAHLPARTLLLDGEAVVFDRHKVSRFQFLQQRANSAKFAVFDCLYMDGKDMRSQPMAARRSVLEKLIPNSTRIFLSRRLARNGLDSYQLAKKRGYEGLVAKDASSFYVERRSTCWLKVKVHQEEEFIIIGFTSPKGARQHLGALLLGAYRSRDGGKSGGKNGGKNKDLYYVGKVGSGFSLETLAMLWTRLQPLINKTPTIVNPVKKKDVQYVKPLLVAQIAFQEWTADMKLRQPVFLGLRNDKSPREVVID